MEARADVVLITNKPPNQPKLKLVELILFGAKNMNTRVTTITPGAITPQSGIVKSIAYKKSRLQRLRYFARTWISLIR
jgi:hypothetical protein